MKKLFFFCAIILISTSCSKCYECKAPFKVITPDTTYTTYQTDELCTASNSELEEKESEGYDCQ
ncbi:MAG: hypothetical protein ACPGEG_06380 [Salibacteraceae bacterium]